MLYIFFIGPYKIICLFFLVFSALARVYLVSKAGQKLSQPNNLLPGNILGKNELVGITNRFIFFT